MRDVERFARSGGATLIHVNHESLALSGAMIAAHLRLPWTCHVRTLLIPGLFARTVYRLINRLASRIVFITERNRQHFATLVGDRFEANKTTVIHNALSTPPLNVEPLPGFETPGGMLRVLSLSNFSPNRGVDRIIEVAAKLAQRQRRDFVFFLCGRPANTRRLLGAKVRYTENMMRRVDETGISEMVRFPGHVSEPERALAACDVLIKLTRQNNPWGRDIIEAMGAGLPVITLGDFQDFVQDRVNGFVDRDFDADRVADHLINLKDDVPMRVRMGDANQRKAYKMFDRRARSADLAEVFQEVLA